VAGSPLYQHRLVDIAVETDYELFALFGNEQDVIDYVGDLMTQVSQIYDRDANTTFQVVFVRVWDTPEDLFNEADPLVPFRNFWNAEMQNVDRDLATFFTGRRDLPYGGVAYLSASCGASGYSVNGFLTGNRPEPDIPASGHYGVTVVAHELGHNFGSIHTHDFDPPIDACFPAPTVPQRGTLMSYCSQTVSGGRYSVDRRFHARVKDVIAANIGGASCIIDDCNRNGISDIIDVNGGGSLDDNNNTIPDECEDCNNNGILDPQEIASNPLLDNDSDGRPDTCQPDCNGNGFPDRYDIEQGVAIDAYGDDIPDECEEDCNNNGISDYTEIQDDLTLDKNRNRRLDVCDDCDGDGTTDSEARAGAHNLWIGSLTTNTLAIMHAQTGVRVGFSEPVLGEILLSDVLITEDGRILATATNLNAVVEFNQNGMWIDNLVPPFAGGLQQPSFLAISNNDTLLVSNGGGNNILEYNLQNGIFIGEFVTAGSGGLLDPRGMTFGTDGHLYVSSAGTNEILRFDGSTGQFNSTFVSAANNDDLASPADLTFIQDGRLLVAGFSSSDIHAYDGQNGTPLGSFRYGGTLNNPWGMKVGPNGNLFVTRNFSDITATAAQPEDDDDIQRLHVTTTRLYEYDITTGYVLGSYVVGNDTNLNNPAGFDFYPGWETDCNVNFTPDACDIESGSSLDVNNNGTPDECEADCNSNGVYDRLDIIPFGNSTDCNANRRPDACDIAEGLSEDCDGNNIPDECESECNGNGTPDVCDILFGTSNDCDGNGVPDECELDCNGNGLTDACDLNNGTSLDCNNSLIPDECELIGTAAYESTELTPFGFGDPIEFVFPIGPEPSQDVTLAVTATADLGSSTEYMDLFLNDQPIGQLFVLNAIDCPSTSPQQELIINREQFLAAQESGEVRIAATATASVSSSLCSAANWVIMELNYEFNQDCDQNGIPDTCEPVVDCNGNGNSDACEISQGLLNDCNDNFVPDECDLEQNTSVDNNGNGVPDECDVQSIFPEDLNVGSCDNDDDCTLGGTCTQNICYVTKNRYLSLRANLANAGRRTARRLSLIKPDQSELVIGWVVPPIQGDFADIDPVVPRFADWSEYPEVVHVFGCAISPGRTYAIRTIDENDDVTNELQFSAPLVLPTSSVWGDIVGKKGPNGWLPPDGFVNFNDVIAVVMTFNNDADAVPVEWADIQDLFPNQTVEFGDISIA
ncbi:MAG: M12 family metallo-peptidase, partial [Phycisphaerae bacterium]